ncbi:unnamed protein product [Sphagnum balticum]
MQFVDEVKEKETDRRLGVPDRSNLLSGHAAAFLLLLLYPALSFIRWIKFLVGFLVCEDVRGKVILITGTSSGIGERGARLVIVARREYLLKQVADRAMKKGAVDVHLIVADAAKQEDCKRFVDETVNKYGRCKSSKPNPESSEVARLLVPVGNEVNVTLCRHGSWSEDQC